MVIDNDVYHIPESPSSADHHDQNRQPSVEDISESEEDSPPTSTPMQRFYQYFPSGAQAGHASETTETRFEQWEREDKEAKRDPWSPFTSRSEWDLSRFMVKHMGQNEIEQFLGLDIIQQTGFHATSKYKFNQSVSTLPHLSDYLLEEINVVGDTVGEDGQVMGESLELWYRDPVECIRELIGNASFRDSMGYAPEKVFLDKDGTERAYNEMWSADWWWQTQEKLPSKATVAPVILASDKTKLTQFRGDQVAWPVYLSIGNISKEKRREVSSGATVLLGYIPVSKLECFSDPEARSLASYRLFHHCMGIMLKSLIEAGSSGVPMTCADGWVRRMYPIVAAYIADHPEQCLVTNVKENFCPRGTISPDLRGEPDGCLLRSVDTTLDLLAQHLRGEDPPDFHAQGLRPVYNPFWRDLPHTDIFSCITPDILHQLHKGVFKDHLVSWCSSIIGKEELDRRFQAMADAPGLRNFKKGISHVQQWTGKEHKEMQRIFVALLAGAVSAEVLTVAQAVVDFIYYAQFQLHTTSSLRALKSAYSTFHQHKHIFQTLGVREHFNIPKLHSMQHYIEAIEQKGCLDGYNTELSERLHIDFAKKAYRSGNRRDYIANMTTWLRRQDAVDLRSAYLVWWDERRRGDQKDDASDSEGGSDTEGVHAHDVRFSPPTQGHRQYRIAKHCPCPRTSVATIQDEYGITNFLPVFRSFIVDELQPTRATVTVPMPSRLTAFEVYKQLKLERPWNPFVSRKITYDRIRATPAVASSGRRKPVPAHFDPAVLIEHPELYQSRTAPEDLTGLRVGRVRLIFELPSEYGRLAHPLLYVEWYTPFTSVDGTTQMFVLSRSTRAGLPNASIVTADRALRFAHLSGKCGREVSKDWKSHNVLDKGTKFLVNPYFTVDMFAADSLYSRSKGLIPIR
ncbi:hypothetical protein PHLGIDRAFT_79771 [Phlebiopsis gigantea 11061_1 CR5-6]|uniref:Uncharacterized protein n=1 Tax=Phlebiopsis gigantea (strain 11061_1 CR5-6) TaxID=745531 RepID=A0A0C3NBX4_PHLG1|nr:hypothetical protein PHLGIDRAFT_79771 [Phlebiopsis gigantea 11061_1 CR5-6]